MLDLTKPIQTRDGRPAKLLTVSNAATRALAALQVEGAVMHIAHRDAVAAAVTNKYGPTEINGYTEFGEFNPCMGESEDDLVNVPEEPARTSEFRTFQPDPRANRNSLGNFRAKSFEELSHLLVHKDNLDRPLWQGVLEIIREDDKVVDVKFHPAKPA